VPQDVRTAPRVSVLMPVRDAEPWLVEAVESLRGQSEASFELIAIDDGSRDRSRVILEAYTCDDPRIRVLETGPHARGITSALNTGLAAARAPVVARMDADDRARPDRLRAQCAALDGDPSLFAVACRVSGFPDTAVGAGMRRYLAWQNTLVEPDELARDRFIESPLVHPSVMMRTGLLRDALGGWRDAAWPEDWDLFLRALEHGLRIARVPRTLFEWRLHPRQTTRTHARYSEESFMLARAHFLAREIVRACGRERPVWVLGAGPVGKRLGKALARERTEVAGFVDVDPRKIGGRIRDDGREWPVIAMDALLAISPRPAAVGAVARPGARRRVRLVLAAAGWCEGSDYFVAA